ncbi:MAG TPA: complex I subunit 5 family protein [Xanthomonadaceae bacterium]|nr:complex I subunit 5 family protein [Xanthomonadaceae bacterium]
MIALPVLLPLLLAALVLVPGRGGAWAFRALPLASLPALWMALLPPDAMAWPWLLLGLRLAVDEFGQAMLLLIGLAWTASAWFASSRIEASRPRFALFWLLALAGLCQSVLAAELAGFYLGYVAMTLAAYGLVVHDGGNAARHAGRVYLIMAFLGEALVLSGLLMLGAHYGNIELAALPADLVHMPTPLTGALLLAGFAVKMGIVPLHLWLPVAHPIAPVPASAILSGVIVKAGLLGALRLVPGESFGAAVPLTALLAVGLFTAFYGVAAGLGQARPKTVLAYSTVSQMGLLFCGLALAMHEPALRALLPLLILHHGLNKAALFLAMGCGAAATRWRLALLVLPALSLAAAPFTGGALAKLGLKTALDGAGLGEGVIALLSLSSAATALLMLHLLARVRAQGATGAMHAAWPLLTAAGLVLPWWLARRAGIDLRPDVPAVWDALWPLLLAALIHAAWRRLRRPHLAVPEGDLLVPVQRLLATLTGWLTRLPRLHVPSWPQDLPARVETPMRRIEQRLATLPMAGLLLLLLVLALRVVLR